jgi:hypothetical protein
MLKNEPVLGQEVTFKGYVELAGGQELSQPVGTISNVFPEEIVVLFEEVLSDKGGHLYNDVVWLKRDELPEVLEGFEYVEE